MNFDDWAYKRKEILFSNYEGQIWAMPYCEEIIHAVLNNQDIDIEKITSNKNKKLYELYIQQEIEPNQKEIENITKNLDNIKKQISEINKIKTIFNDFKQDIDNIFIKHSKIINETWFKIILSSYFYNGVFEKGYAYDNLTQPSSGLINKLTKGIPFKKLKKDIDVFLQKYEKLNIKNIIENLSMSKSKDYFSGRIIDMINNIFRETTSLDLQSYNWQIKELEEMENNLKDEQNKYEQKIKDLNNKILKQKESVKNSKTIQNEYKIIRDFAQEIRQERQNPKKLDISNYVIGLNDMPDDDIVMFNIGLTCGDENIAKIENILKYNELEFGNDIKKWYIRCEDGDNSDKGKFELFSPLMTAKEAKSIMPKLIDWLDKAHLSSGLVIPIKAKQLFANWNKNPDETEIKQDDLKQLIFGAILRQNLKSYTKQFAEKEIHNLGFNTVEELPYSFYSLDEIKEKFPKDKFLFSGSTASDDYLLLSGRNGRTGTIYTTPNIEYASFYDGVTDVGKGESVPATGNKYVSSIISKLYNEDVKVGFINVYAQSSNDMYFSNFGMEDYRRSIGSKGIISSNKILTRDRAINEEYDSETFVTPEKNPLVEKILHIKYNGKELFIPVNENKTNKCIQDILNNRVADIKNTFQNTDREDILNRFEAQQKQYKKIMFEKGNKKIVKKDDLYTEDFVYSNIGVFEK